MESSFWCSSLFVLSSESVSIQKMKQLKMKVSEAKLKVLRQLRLVELDRRDRLRLVMWPWCWSGALDLSFVLRANSDPLLQFFAVTLSSSCFSLSLIYIFLQFHRPRSFKIFPCSLQITWKPLWPFECQDSSEWLGKRNIYILQVFYASIWWNDACLLGRVGIPLVCKTKSNKPV